MHICVPSLGRASSSSTLRILKNNNLLENTYIFVYDFDYDKYKSVYPEANIITVGTEKNLSRKRNKILDYAQEQGWKYILMLDDDVKGMAIKSEDGRYKRTEDYRIIWSVYEDIAKQLDDKFTVLSPKKNFLYTESFATGLLGPYNHFSAVMFFNLENLKDARYNDVLVEDIDLFLKLNLSGHRTYLIKYFTMNGTMGQKGGLQDYTKLQERYAKGLAQLKENYPDADEFIYVTKRGFLGLDSRKFKKYIQLHYPENYISTEDIPKIKNQFDSLDIEFFTPNHRIKETEE